MPKKGKKKNVSATKEQGRTGIAQTFYLDDDLLEAVQEYRRSQEIKPSKTAVFVVALKSFLASKGFWPRDIVGQPKE